MATPHKGQCVRCAADFSSDYPKIPQAYRLKSNACIPTHLEQNPDSVRGILTYVKEFLGEMTEKMQTDDVLSRQAVFVRCCLEYSPFKICITA